MPSPFRIAVIATEYKRETHADVIVSRWIKPFPNDETLGWTASRSQIASMYVAQTPPEDISEKLCADAGIPRFNTVTEALTLGGPKLAVDAILLIGEHGSYPENEFGQKMYPRKELFDQVVDVFRKNGQVRPIFFDKHFSWNITWAHAMYWTIRDMKIPFFGGSSLPYSGMLPPIDMSPSPCKEIVAIYWNSLEHYLFHSLEIVESLLEKSPVKGSGISSIVAWKGEDVWTALDAGLFSGELLDEAAKIVSPEAAEAMRRFRHERGESAHAFQLTYRNGTKVTHVMQTDLIRKWSLAVEFENSQRAATYMDAGGRDRFFPHFAILDRLIEDFFLTEESPISLDRLYLTTMATAVCMQALATPGQTISTPWILQPPQRTPAPSRI